MPTSDKTALVLDELLEAVRKHLLKCADSELENASRLAAEPDAHRWWDDDQGRYQYEDGGPPPSSGGTSEEDQWFESKCEPLFASRRKR